ncbi:MAG: Bug family tripartite tricarboxylate transporter substrate binding protein [Rubrivivax sp.]|nr:Bug family tripartite tricarboxylate transporter substrate binding protein [Rubrivivax sp.]
MNDRRHLLLTFGAVALGAGLPGPAGAQAPAPALDTVRILTGFPPGGTVDVVARRLADRLRGTYARTMLVENKPGAGGRLAVEELRRAAPDGTTLLITPAAMVTLYPHLYPKLSYGIDDVTAVCGATTVVFGLAVGPAVPEGVRTLKDFLDWARVTPARASFGSPGAGSPPHYVGALLDKESGVALNHVPYRGTVPGVQDTLGGQIASFIGPIGDYLPHLKTGRLRVLATSGPTRTRFLPDVPTFTELGFKPLEQVEWYGFFLPWKAAPDVVARAANALRSALAGPEMAEGLAPFGLEVAATPTAQLARAVREEHAAWAPVVKRVGFTPES